MVNCSKGMSKFNRFSVQMPAGVNRWIGVEVVEE